MYCKAAHHLKLKVTKSWMSWKLIVTKADCHWKLYVMKSWLSQKLIVTKADCHKKLNVMKSWLSQKLIVTEADCHRKLNVTEADCHKSWLSQKLIVTKADCPKLNVRKLNVTKLNVTLPHSFPPLLSALTHKCLVSWNTLNPNNGVQSSWFWKCVSSAFGDQISEHCPPHPEPMSVCLAGRSQNFEE